jgi:hypothetical protein
LTFWPTRSRFGDSRTGRRAAITFFKAAVGLEAFQGDVVALAGGPGETEPREFRLARGNACRFGVEGEGLLARKGLGEFFKRLGRIHKVGPDGGPGRFARKVQVLDKLVEAEIAEERHHRRAVEGLGRRAGLGVEVDGGVGVESDELAALESSVAVGAQVFADLAFHFVGVR